MCPTLTALQVSPQLLHCKTFRLERWSVPSQDFVALYGPWGRAGEPLLLLVGLTSLGSLPSLDSCPMLPSHGPQA